MHTHLFEDRLEALESNVNILLGIPPGISEDLSGDKDKKIMNLLPHYPSIEHLAWAAFSKSVDTRGSKFTSGEWIHRPEISSIRKNVIEILIEEPREAKSPSRGNRNESIPDIDPDLYVPWLLRIRSPLMLKLLERITEQKATIGPYKHQLVLLR